MKKLNKNNKGFSLVELLVVIAIMVVLVGVVAPTLLNNIEKSREAKDVQTLDAIAGAIQGIMTDETAYTEILTNLSGKVFALNDLYTNDKTKTKMAEYLAQPKFPDDIAGSVAKSKGKGIYVFYNEGRISVFVGTAASLVGTITLPNAATDSAAGYVVGKRDTKYLVTR